MAIINGWSIAEKLKKDLGQRIEDHRKTTGNVPCLTAVIVGDNLASNIYVKNKIKACEEVGICARKINLSSHREIANCIRELNSDNTVHGYILQLPIPDANSSDFFSLFDPLKDVDVFHPENVGLMVQGRPRFLPCTPRGIQIMLHSSGVRVSGKRVAIINRSNVVGRPLSSMLIQDCDDYANATVTVCHDKTPPNTLKEIVKDADIVIVAVGIPAFITKNMVRCGQVIVDVGINRVVIDGKNKIVGDVDFNSVSEIVDLISPVPGGCGPLTVYVLLENTFTALKFLQDRTT